MRLVIPVLSLSLFSASLAVAGPDQGRCGFGGLDADDNGLITREEAAAFPQISAGFDEVDTNLDGLIDQEEMNAHRKSARQEQRAAAKERWSDADADGSGQISRDEAAVSMPMLAGHFEMLDANGDGEVSRSEVRKARYAHRQKARAQFNERWEAADIDGDGTLDLAEAQTGFARLAEQFSTVDADNDGKITRQEMKARSRY